MATQPSLLSGLRSRRVRNDASPASDGEAAAVTSLKPVAAKPASTARDFLRRTTGFAGNALRSHPRLAGVILILVLASAYFLVQTMSPAAPEYITATAIRGDIEDSVTAVGSLQPRDYVDVGAQVSGQLKKLYVNIGDRVKKGQLLAEIDPQVLSAKVESDKANLANLTAQLGDRNAQVALTRAEFDRQLRLQKAQATSQSSYDAARQAMHSASAQASAIAAQIKAAQSQLDGDSVTLGYTRIYAPMDGTVASITTKQGMTVNANQQAPIILRIADLSIMTVWTQVSEADVAKLKVGMKAYFTTLGSSDKRWYGTLSQIQPTPSVTNNVVLYTATFDVRNPDGLLMTQMTAQVFFIAASARNVILVPVSALRERRSASRPAGAGQRDSSASGTVRTRPVLTPAVRAALKRPGARRYTVQVIDASGAIERRVVAVGVSNHVSAEVIAGLKEGETVVAGIRTTNTTSSTSGTRASTRPGGFGGPGHP